MLNASFVFEKLTPETLSKTANSENKDRDRDSIEEMLLTVYGREELTVVQITTAAVDVVGDGQIIGYILKV